MAKQKNAKKDKQAKGGAPDGVATLSSHPRASRDLLRGRGWGGLAGFLLVAWISFQAGAPVADVVLRAIVGGTVGVLVGWAAAVMVWRALAVAEIRAAHRRVEERIAAATEARERQGVAA